MKHTTASQVTLKPKVCPLHLWAVSFKPQTFKPFSEKVAFWQPGTGNLIIRLCVRNKTAGRSQRNPWQSAFSSCSPHYYIFCFQACRLSLSPPQSLPCPPCLFLIPSLRRNVVWQNNHLLCVCISRLFALFLPVSLHLPPRGAGVLCAHTLGSLITGKNVTAAWNLALWVTHSSLPVPINLSEQETLENSEKPTKIIY